jgi:PAS domain S-box-containing protein
MGPHGTSSLAPLSPLEHLPVITYVDEIDEAGATTMAFLSGQHEQIIGFTLADFPPGESYWNTRIHPDDVAGYRERYERSWRQRVPLEAMYRFRRKDGSWIWLEDRGTPVYDATRRRTVISGVVFDVTAHRAEHDAAARTRRELQEQAREDLRVDLDERLGELAEREANYRSLFESVDDMVVVCDLEGRILESNPAAAHMTGYSTDELRGMAVQDLHPPELRGEATEIVAAMLAGLSSACPLPLLTADGAVIPTETRAWHGAWDGRPCIFGICRDLVAEREATERFDRVFHASPALMAVSARDNGDRFLEVNDAWLRTLGFTRDEVVGRTSAELGLFPEADEHQALARQLSTTGSIRDARLRVRTKDGSLLDGIFFGELIRSQGKTYFLTVMMDDTERRRAEDALRELNMSLEQRIDERTMQLEAANRELNGFVNSVAHDLRGPLRTIGSFGQILEVEHYAELSDEGRDAVRRIVRANGRMERLIDALLDLSGLTRQPLRVGPTDLSGIAGEVLRDLHEAHPERQVEAVVAPGLQAAADPALVRLLLENLLGNAWKFTARREVAHIEFGCDRAGAEEVYYVRDDGAGFDHRYAKRLFRPFERLHADTEFEGTGIGLATVSRVAERHGGRCWAKGKVGEGATFYFTLEPGD